MRDAENVTRLLRRAPGVLLAVALLFAYPLLHQRLGTGGTAAAVAFHLAYLMCLLAAGSLALRWEATGRAVSTAVRGSKVLTGVFLANCLVLTLIILSVLTQVGVLAVMVGGSAAILALAPLDGARQAQLISATLRSSPLSFAAIYLCLGAGELYLRFHPMQVGGGGGGNPALARLYAGLYSRNALGLRGDDVSPAPADGSFRILALGDSYTFGQGVPLRDTYPWQLEQQLNTGADSVRFEVLNAGESGANTTDEVRYVEEHGLRLQPHLITLQFFLNDLESRFTGTAGVANRVVDAVIKRPFRRSYLIFFLRYRFDSIAQRMARASRPSGTPRDWVEQVAQVVRDEGPGWQQYLAALGELGALSRTHDIPVSVIVFPPMVRDIDQTVRSIHREVVGACREAGFHVIDLTDAFHDVPVEERIVSDIDHHPAGKVFEIAAREIAASLGNAGLIPSGPPEGPPRLGQ